MTLSDEQLYCVTQATGTSDNLLIRACAGGAKTTTMVEIAKAFGPGRRIVALAFGTDAATSLTAKMPYYVESSTFHTFCKRALEKHLGVHSLRADRHKCKWILKELVPDWKMRREIEDDVLTLVSRFKSTTLPLDLANLAKCAERFDFDLAQGELSLAQQLLERCLVPPFKTIDFDDMLWLTFHLGVSFPPVAVILLDEAQDTNGVQRALLARILNDSEHAVRLSNAPIGQRPRPRLIAVGDANQSIFGFRGADHNAMDALRRDFNMKDLELSVSYRCSQAVVAEARKYL